MKSDAIRNKHFLRIMGITQASCVPLEESVTQTIQRVQLKFLFDMLCDCLFLVVWRCICFMNYYIPRRSYMSLAIALFTYVLRFKAYSLIKEESLGD